MTLLVAVGRPETGGVGRQKLIDQAQIAVQVHAKLELGVGDDDAVPRGVVPACLVDGKAGLPEPLRQIGPERLGHGIEGDIEIVAGFSLGCGREEWRIQALAFHQSLRQPLARQGSPMAIFRPGRPRQITAHHTFEGHGRGPPNQHGPARQLGADASQLRYAVDDFSGSRGDVVRGKYVGQALEPEGTDLSQHCALVRHRLPHHHVERAHPIARDDQKMLVVYLIDLAHLSPAKQRERQPALHQRGLRPHTTTSVASASAASGRARPSSGCRYSSMNSGTCCAALPV